MPYTSVCSIKCKHLETPPAKSCLPRVLILSLAIAASICTVTRAEEKQFYPTATVSALYDGWDTTSSSLQSLLFDSFKARVALLDGAGTLGDGSKGFRIDFG